MLFLASLSSFVGFRLTALFVLRMLPSAQRPTITPVQLSYRIDLPPEDPHLAPTALLFILALPTLRDSRLCPSAASMILPKRL